MIKTKQRIIFRIDPYNCLSFPVLLNAWERDRIDKQFEILIRSRPLSPGETRNGDVVLFSFMTPFLPDIHGEIKTLKQTGKDIRVAGGGPHITGEQELSFQLGFDTLFTGPGERTFLQFGKDLIGNRPIPGQYVYRADSDRADNDFNDFLPLSKHHMDTIPPLEIMRGCSWKCKYCSTPLHAARFRTPTSIAAYLAALRERGIARVNYISPSALEYGAPRGRRTDTDKIAELLELTRSYGFRFIEYGIFPSEIRPDTVTGKAMALLKKYVSHKFVTIGAQSGLTARLKELRRGHTVADIEQAAAVANANGFSVHLDFIVGYPDETTEERRTTIEFIKKTNKKYRIRTHLHHFIPLAGSPYEYRLPSFLPDADKEELRKLKSAGIAEDGWVENEKHAHRYFDWLKTHFPHYYERYR